MDVTIRHQNEEKPITIKASSVKLNDDSQLCIFAKCGRFKYDIRLIESFDIDE